MGVLERWSSPRMTWRDGHRDVVDDDRQVVDDGAVGALHDEVADGLVGHLDRAAQQVVEDGRSGAHLEAQRPGLAGGLAAGDLVGAEVAAGAAVDPGALVGLGGAALGFELVGGVKTGVEVARGHELVDVLAVDRLAFGLAVGRVRARLLGALVPVELHLAQGAQDLGDGLVGRARRVGVFDAQHEVAAALAREEVVVQRGARAAQVQVAGGRRGEADADGCGHGTIVPHGYGRRPRRRIRTLPLAACL